MKITATIPRGFTLLELMVAITVLGVLLGIGVPAFNDMIRNNRVAAQANEFTTALSLARSEAARRGMPVAVCASNAAQNACAGDDVDNWGNGWLIFSDRDGSAGDMDGDDELIQAFGTGGNGLLLTTDDIGFVRFGANGGLLAPAAPVVFELRHEVCRGENLRQISLIATGRANLAKVNCP